MSRKPSLDILEGSCESKAVCRKNRSVPTEKCPCSENHEISGVPCPGEGSVLEPVKAVVRNFVQ